MNLVIINGNSNRIAGQRILTAARIAARPETNIQLINPEESPDSVEDYLDEEFSSKAVVSEIIHYRNQVDGFIIACFSDPGLYAAREVVDNPIVGIAESSMITALQLGHQFCILSPLRRLRPVLFGLVRKYGFENRCSGITTIEIPVASAVNQEQSTVDAFLRAGQTTLKNTDAEVLILGGAVLAGMETVLSEKLGVPVIDPVKCAVSQAECLFQLKLKTSKIGGFAYPYTNKYSQSKGNNND